VSDLPTPEIPTKKVIPQLKLCLPIVPLQTSVILVPLEVWEGNWEMQTRMEWEAVQAFSGILLFCYYYMNEKDHL